MKVRYIIALFIAAFLVQSCGSSFLEDAKVQRDLFKEYFYKTEDDAKLAVNAMYSPLHWYGLFKRHRYLLGYMAGDCIPTSGAGQVQAYHEFKFGPSDNELVAEAWTTCYAGIGRANLVLERVPEIPFEDEKIQQRYLAEAHFMRAFYYFNLVRMYGDVPLYTRSYSGDLDDPLLVPERTDASVIYDLIEEDLLKAKGILPAEYPTADIGRPTSGAATGYLGKVFLFRKKYAEAVKEFKEIKDGLHGMYDLVPFDQIWGVANNNNKESIFEIQYLAGFGTPWPNGDNTAASKSNWVATAVSPGSGSFANALPSEEVNDFFNMYPEENQLRRYYTIARSGDVWQSWNPIREDPTAEVVISEDEVIGAQWNARTKDKPYGYFSGIRKFAEGPDDRRGFNQCPNNYAPMRYADVLLMLAEAENELNGPTALAYESINMVRSRAQVDPIPAGLGKDEFFEKVVVERRLELTFEWHRFFDLVRWMDHPNRPEIGKAENMPGFVVGRNEVLPIPQNEIQTNPNLKQNNY
ncbi:RagB/SusD family nutrient uptake outer membrane protein [Persicobacter psychrovividus]|uniref:Membrane protein n=1 Tax=Persicobacter psychrovividus TaxID=387638 RepID=A0ABM7VI95_9BACT|nr:membrane protein [Persicobacter psychrovividus]